MEHRVLAHKNNIENSSENSFLSVDSTVLPAREGPAVVQGKLDWQGLRSRDENKVVVVSSAAGSVLHTD